MKEKTVLIAGDHAGVALKEEMQPVIEGLGYAVEDLGPEEVIEGDDYPDYMHALAKRVRDERCPGIIFGGSGQGEAIVCNRYVGVRAAVYYGGSEDIIRLSREHNDANVLSLGARFLTQNEAQNAIELWLQTDFSETERHVRRIAKIDS